MLYGKQASKQAKDDDDDDEVEDCLHRKIGKRKSLLILFRKIFNICTLACTQILL